MPRNAAPFETVGEMLEQLGRIDPRRVRLRPPPGQATEKDVLNLLDRENRLYELVDGILVEKVMGLKESALAADLGGWVTPFVREHDLGIVAGRTARCVSCRGLSAFQICPLSPGISCRIESILRGQSRISIRIWQPKCSASGIPLPKWNAN